MAQTKYNMLVKLVFDREVFTTDMTTLHQAFSMDIKQKDSYHQPLYDKTINAESVSYAIDSQDAPVRNTIIVKFSETDNFRKAIGPVKLKFNNSAGNIYGPKPKDALPTFEKEFTPVNIDLYQNPDTMETVKITETITGSSIVIPTVITEISPVADSIKILGTISNTVITPILIGVINP